MKKTVLLCFIHGFKGGDDTFGADSEFAQHLAALLSAALPKVDVRAITYPQYETRGDLFQCVARFREWLLEQVIDIEVANGTPSPTVEPSVRTILIGHSMGGIVAAETAIAIAGEQVIEHPQEGEGKIEIEGQGEEKSEGEPQEAEDKHDGGEEEKSEGKEAAKTEQQPPPPPSPGLNSLMFPYIQGVLAFDTPFLGISPGVVAHSAEGHYNTASAAMTQLSALGSMIWGAENSGNKSAAQDGKKPAGLLMAPSDEKDNGTKGIASKGSTWGWGKIAMAAGGAVAVAAGGAAAYVNREQITSGWSWVSSHLEFVGCLARGEELKSRVRAMVRLSRELDVGFATLYTRLGAAAQNKNGSVVGRVIGNQRTFCNVPKTMAAGLWREAINDKATDEIGAHMGMFEAKENPAYGQLAENAKLLIAEWARNDWYETSTMGDIE
ncbi:hypothetical protein F5Y15DRAFT_142524 [Xylariaceae sp. FL0016]|nr:hypothetical protein F5Y15DRAFT_142524 [Xylariaceae sp. FL0016]